PRFYDATSGAVKIDGIDVRRLRLADLRRQIAVVPQDSLLFNETILANILVGRPTASREEAEAAIAGYLVVNDVSERAFQLERGGQWLKGKSAPTFNPAGPWLVTPDEIADLAALGMRLDVNGERRQDGSTSTMVFDPAEIVRYVSQFLVLEPGDLINTGTPHGVGMGMSPPQYLRPGDVMELEIDGLGRQRQRVVASG
ncbi:MAG TPA: fumarylacetoacetate hydrolase family protein, partial [Actinotalea sp.]|nr:fumarylacetoacetate hydrolase family protein [Actinotalea sp.]